MRTVEREVTGAILISKDNKILLVRKNLKRDEVYMDYWIIPGGGIEDGEKKEQALIREIKEETGINILSYKIELVDSEGRGESTRSLNGERVLCKMKFYDYRIRIDDKKSEELLVELDDELGEYKWADKNDLKLLKISPPSERLFKKLKYL